MSTEKGYCLWTSNGLESKWDAFISYLYIFYGDVEISVVCMAYISWIYSKFQLKLSLNFLKSVFTKHYMANCTMISHASFVLCTIIFITFANDKKYLIQMTQATSPKTYNNNHASWATVATTESIIVFYFLMQSERKRVHADIVKRQISNH